MHDFDLVAVDFDLGAIYPIDVLRSATGGPQPQRASPPGPELLLPGPELSPPEWSPPPEPEWSPPPEPPPEPLPLEPLPPEPLPPEPLPLEPLPPEPLPLEPSFANAAPTRRLLPSTSGEAASARTKVEPISRFAI